MAKVFTPDDKRFKNLNDVWDIPRYKLVVFVVEGKDIASNAKSQIFTQVRVERKVFGKTANHNTAEPKFAGLFWVGFDDAEIKTLVFEVFDKKTNLGEVRISLNKVPKESLVDAWAPLKPSAEGKKKGGEQPVQGMLHLRYVLSAISETRPTGNAGAISHEYFYKKNNLQFRSGDLLAFSGTGLIETVNKVISNSEHSHVGLIVSIPNRWHGEDELYVLEMTYNLDGMIDPFTDTPRKGLCLFRLRERIHQYHGGLITHYPLKKQLDSIPLADLADAVRRVHQRDELPSITNTIATQFILRNFPFDPKKNFREFIALTGPKFVAQALAHIAQLKEDQFPPPVDLNLEWLKRQPIWDRPNLVRMPSESLKMAMATIGRGNSTIKKVVAGGDAAPPAQDPAPAAARPPPPAAAAPTNPAMMNPAFMNPAMAMPMNPAMGMNPAMNPAMGGYAMNPALMAHPGYASSPLLAAPQVSASPMASPSLSRAKPPSFAAPPAAADPQLAAMEAEMKRLEQEAALQARMMEEQARKLEQEQRALEAAMLASEIQMKQLQMQAHADEEGHSEEADDDGSLSANANLMALTGAGFNPNAYSYSPMMMK